MTEQSEREAIATTCDRIAQRMGGRFVLNEDRPMTDKPEPVAWMYQVADSRKPVLSTERIDVARFGSIPATETPLCPAPITLHESQVRWRQAFDEMHQRAMKAEAALAIPTERDASALVEALRQAGAAMDEYYRYWTGGETRGSYDGKPERNALWAAMYKARAALSAWEQSNG